jgi:PTH1 family peptidyl-tRNA hydrolase
VKLVAGLGNPGEKYRGTRHNVGFDVVDLLARRHDAVFEMAPADALQARWRTALDAVVIVKPLTFMNLSGQAIAAIARFYKIELADILVVCDDVNLPLGRLRVRTTGSEGGHNGLRSVAQVFGTIDYPRLRVGVGRGDSRRDLADYVLSRFEADEEPIISAAIARAAAAVEVWNTDGVATLMNTFNGPRGPEGPGV